MVDKFLGSFGDYIQAKAVVLELALGTARRVTGMDVEGSVNAADNLDDGDIFLTVTGTSAESGDDGEAGRGNRVSGLITPYRPMTMEAAAGKNPVTHVGKLYNLAATRISNRIVSDLGEVAGATCVLVSQIGRAVHDPEMADIQLETKIPIQTLTVPVQSIVNDELSRFGELQAELLAGRVPMY